MSDITVTPEYTPNPNAVRFTVNRTLNPEKRGKSFMKQQDTTGQPLFEKLWSDLGEGILSIYCVNNFFTITQNGKLDWGDAIPKIEQAVKAHVK
jgi:hypothetical protein